MKLVLAMLALISTSAFAGALDAKQYGYEDEANFPKVATACVDGKTQWFTESVPGLDKYVQVLRTCQNGAWYPRTKTIAQPCKEGATAVWSVSNSVNDNQASATFVCVNGKYVRQ